MSEIHIQQRQVLACIFYKGSIHNFRKTCAYRCKYSMPNNAHMRQWTRWSLVQINQFITEAFIQGRIWFDSFLTNWDRMMRICVNKLTSIGSDNGFSSERGQAIIWTNVWILLIGPLGTNFSEIIIEIYTFLFKKMPWIDRLGNGVHFVSQSMC